MTAYELWKLVHVLSAAVMFGAGVGIGFFCWSAWRIAVVAGEPGPLRGVLRLAVQADAWLTVPTVIVQAVSGIVLSELNDWPLLSPWSLAVWASFTGVGFLWLALARRERQLAAQAQTSSGAAEPALRRLFAVWARLALATTAGTVVIFWLMVARPLPVSGF